MHEWRRYFRKETAPGWILLALTTFNAVVRLVQYWGDIDFLVSDAKEWIWLTDVLLSPWFALVALVLGMAWLLLVGGHAVRVTPHGRQVAQPAKKEPTQEPGAVDYAGIRWVRTGWHPDMPDTPTVRAECPQHKGLLFYRELTAAGVLSVPRLPRDTDLVGLPQLGRLWCVDGSGHSVDVQAEVPPGASFGQLRRVAQALLSP